MGLTTTAATELAVRVRGADGEDRGLIVKVEALVLAGYTGRDRANVLAHIAELERAGVAPPARVPSVFVVPPSLATCADAISVTSDRTSGEAEFVLITTAAGRLAGVGSDHTDRALETIDVDRAKAACAKVIGADVWRYEDVLSRWDRLELRSWSTRGGVRRLYQEGTLSEFLEVDRLVAELGSAGQPDRPGRVLFGGTLPLREGPFEFGDRFEAELRDPRADRSLRLDYRIRRPS